MSEKLEHITYLIEQYQKIEKEIEELNRFALMAANGYVDTKIEFTSKNNAKMKTDKTLVGSFRDFLNTCSEEIKLACYVTDAEIMTMLGILLNRKTSRRHKIINALKKQGVSV